MPEAKAFSRRISTWVNRPPRLLSTWTTPRRSPVRSMTGMLSRFRVRKPETRSISGLKLIPVDPGVEARILVGVVDDLGDTRDKDRAGDAYVLRYADLGHPVSAGNPRKQLPGVGVVQKERGPLDIERLGDQLDQAGQLMVEREPLGDRVGDFDEHLEPPDRFVDPLRQRQFAAERCRHPVEFRSGRGEEVRLGCLLQCGDRRW